MSVQAGDVCRYVAAPVQAFYHAWEQCREADQEAALETIEGFTRSPGRYSTKQKCRDLTLMRSPLPSSMSSVPPLSEEDVAGNAAPARMDAVRGGAPGITPPVRARASPRRSSGTPIRESPTRPMTNKSGHGPRTSLGYQFDSTMGYPGEGPSHSPFTRRGTRPSLRIWSTKRPARHMVDPLRVRLDVSPIPLAPKLAHGNSDTRLGRWLHSSRSPLSTGLSQADSPRRDNNVEKDTSPVSRVPTQTLRVLMISTSFMRTDDRSREAVARMSAGPTEHSATLRSSSHPDPAVPLPPRHDAMVTTSLSRREFIRKFALQRGVTGAALDAIWRSK